MTSDTHALDTGAARPAAPASRRRRWMGSHGWAIVGALSVTETVSYGILYYAFAVFLVPMQAGLGFSAAELTGAFSLALMVSAGAGIAVGHYLDRHSPRELMTAGSVAGVLLVLAWSQVHSLAAFYGIWVGMGFVMAAVLYEPAFTVVAKHFPIAAERRRAMTAMTLVAALASFIFLPLSQALIDAHGWRDALVVLALLLAAVTVPLHFLVLRPAPDAAVRADRRTTTSAASRAQPSAAHPIAAEPIATEPIATDPSVTARDALRSRPFWMLSIAFVLASVAAIAMMVHAIPFLVEQGHSAAFAAFAVGLVGISQIPGRLLYATIAARLPRPHATASLFVLIALGVAVIVSVNATWAVVIGLVLLGMGNGMGTLARATAIADLYGAAAYGTIASVAAAMTTTARAAGPVAAAVYAAAVGYGALLWTLAGIAAIAAVLAYRAEVLAGAGSH